MPRQLPGVLVLAAVSIGVGLFISRSGGAPDELVIVRGPDRTTTTGRPTTTGVSTTTVFDLFGDATSTTLAAEVSSPAPSGTRPAPRRRTAPTTKPMAPAPATTSPPPPSTTTSPPPPSTTTTEPGPTTTTTAQDPCENEEFRMFFPEFCDPPPG
jgi:hypothetical protein